MGPGVGMVDVKHTLAGYQETWAQDAHNKGQITTSKGQITDSKRGGWG